MPEVIFHCAEAQSNKFWSYEKIGTDVRVKWGRVGLAGQEQLQQFGSSGAADAFIAQKVREKTKKGYKQVSQEKLQKEVQLAKELGWQHKIDKMKWGRLNEKKQEIALTRDYDPAQFVYVEILNSWNKNRVRLLLSKDKSFYIEGVAIEGQTIAYDSLRPASNDGFVSGVRSYLRRLAEKVVEVVRTTMGSFGRKLNLGLGPVEPETAAAGLPSAAPVAVEEEVDVYSAVGESDSSISREAVCQLATLGCRKLEL